MVMVDGDGDDAVLRPDCMYLTGRRTLNEHVDLSDDQHAFGPSNAVRGGSSPGEETLFNRNRYRHRHRIERVAIPFSLYSYSSTKACRLVFPFLVFFVPSFVGLWSDAPPPPPLSLSLKPTFWT